ncbi:MAG: sulfur carrier protein ThiS adenylyltransferase ThiF [Calditrichia bacterium]
MVKIGIAGVGGIGSNVAVNLVRTGITRLKIADFDRIEASNLNRQFYFADQIGLPKVEALKENLRRINPLVEIEAARIRLARENMPEFFRDCDILVEGFDRAECKKEFYEAFHADSRPVVMANGVAGDNPDEVRVRPVGNGFIVGDFKSDVNSAGVFSPKVTLVAAIMSDLVLKMAGQYKKVKAKNQKGWCPEWQSIRFPKASMELPRKGFRGDG